MLSTAAFLTPYEQAIVHDNWKELKQILETGQSHNDTLITWSIFYGAVDCLHFLLHIKYPLASNADFLERVIPRLIAHNTNSLALEDLKERQNKCLCILLATQQYPLTAAFQSQWIHHVYPLEAYPQLDPTQNNYMAAFMEEHRKYWLAHPKVYSNLCMDYFKIISSASWRELKQKSLDYAKKMPHAGFPWDGFDHLPVCTEMSTASLRCIVRQCQDLARELAAVEKRSEILDRLFFFTAYAISLKITCPAQFQLSSMIFEVMSVFLVWFKNPQFTLYYKLNAPNVAATEWIAPRPSNMPTDLTWSVLHANHISSIPNQFQVQLDQKRPANHHFIPVQELMKCIGVTYQRTTGFWFHNHHQQEPLVSTINIEAYPIWMLASFIHHVSYTKYKRDADWDELKSAVPLTEQTFVMPPYYATSNCCIELLLYVEWLHQIMGFRTLAPLLSHLATSELFGTNIDCYRLARSLLLYLNLIEYKLKGLYHCYNLDIDTDEIVSIHQHTLSYNAKQQEL